jgi:undecaprenyl-diphosphatase
MNLFQALILGLVQGATEFIPVSSSAHLVLVPWLFRWHEPGLPYDTIVHWGTLAAVLAFFWSDLLAMVRAVLSGLLRRDPLGTPEARLAWLIVLGTIPAVTLGVLLENFFERVFSTPLAVAVLLLVTGLVLALSERLSHGRRELRDLRWADALIVGLAQAAAILPGISRSGVTISAGLGRAVRREASARFSFLLAIPVILGAGLLQLLRLVKAGGFFAQAPALLVGFVAAAVAGYLCIRFLLHYLQNHRLYLFSLYCWLFGAACLLIALLRGG